MTSVVVALGKSNLIYEGLHSEQSLAVVQVTQSAAQAVHFVSDSLKNPDAQVSHLSDAAVQEVQLATVQATQV